ncbi:MAG: ATP-grasp domain-containing protein [Pirellulaceae bacterium]|nr:ATP-grasp domain-containing protein [Pirellulaceae bacterium]
MQPPATPNAACPTTGWNARNGLPASRPRLLLLGASVRAAAQSAWRAGYQPLAADLFADADLRRLTAARPATPYPAGLLAASRRLPDAPWMYTGALENHPEILETLAGERPLWGIPAATVRQLRNPWVLSEAVAGSGWQVPRLCRTLDDRPAAGPTTCPPLRWLRKPFRSAGGSRITWAGDRQPDRGDYYYQQFEPGLCCSAVFVADRGTAHCLGISRQLTGCAWLGGQGFQYCGNLGPWPASDELLAAVRDLGRRLCGQFDLRGLFGADLILGADALYCLEVNPRYTASVEVLERAAPWQAIGLHALACQQLALPQVPVHTPAAVYGKGILYARRPAAIGSAFVRWAERWNASRGWPRIADIPLAGQRIHPGRPITTLLVQGGDPSEAAGRLRRFARLVQRLVAN